MPSAKLVSNFKTFLFKVYDKYTILKKCCCFCHTSCFHFLFDAVYFKKITNTINQVEILKIIHEKSVNFSMAVNNDVQ